MKHVMMETWLVVMDVVVSVKLKMAFHVVINQVNVLNVILVMLLKIYVQ